MTRFATESGSGASHSVELWEWSITEPAQFWRAVWDFAGIIGDPGDRPVHEAERFYDWRFLPDARLNIAENMIGARPHTHPDRPAVIEISESGHRNRSVSWLELNEMVHATAAAMRHAGVRSRSVVAGWLPNCLEAVVTMIASAALGATFTSASPDFGARAVLDRFAQTQPTLIVGTSSYHYKGTSFNCLNALTDVVDELDSVRAVWVVDYLSDGRALPSSDRFTTWHRALERHRGETVTLERFEFDHPLFVLYSSGTTGVPKAFVHRGGGVLLKTLSEHLLHCNLRPGDRFLYHATCGWMMWNWLVLGLASGTTIVLYDGNPGYPKHDRLFTIAADHGVNTMGVSAAYLHALMANGNHPGRDNDLSRVRTLLSTGSPLSPEAFEWVYASVGSDLHLASISGGTDLCGGLVTGDPTRPVHAGEIQGPALGMAIDIFDGDGQPTPPGVPGELVCTAPFPSMPLRLVGDTDHRRYQATYFERYPNVWHHGDWATKTINGGIKILGRSDTTINAGGVRIGTAELYRVLDRIPEVTSAVAVAQRTGFDDRIVLFVQLAENAILTDAFVDIIKSRIRAECSPRHVPTAVAHVSAIPVTRTGKIAEAAVTAAIHGRTIDNRDALSNPGALDDFMRWADQTTSQDAAG